MKVKNIFKLAYIYFLSFISRALRERINRKVYRCSVKRTTNFSLYLFFISRQPLTFPGRLQPSIISRLCLNRRVRYGYGCFPQTHRHRNLSQALFQRLQNQTRSLTQIKLFSLLTFSFRSSPRPISISKLNTLLYLHL